MTDSKKSKEFRYWEIDKTKDHYLKVNNKWILCYWNKSYKAWMQIDIAYFQFIHEKDIKDARNSDTHPEYFI